MSEESLVSIDEFGHSVKIEYYVYEKSCKNRLKRFFLKHRTTSLCVLLLLASLKLLTCVLYVYRVCKDTQPKYANCYNCTAQYEDVKDTASLFYEIRWWALVWVSRPVWMWATQVGIAIFTLIITALMTVLRYKGNKRDLLTFNLLLELTTTLPFIVTLFSTPLINLFIPVFLNAWLAKMYITSIFNSGKTQSILARQIVTVLTTLICLVFTAMCCFEHAERSSTKEDTPQVTIFSAFYFILVTLSSVGYGDITPSVWISQILVVLVIFTALGILPRQLEKLLTTWQERQKLGGTYTKSKKGENEKHVVLCLPTLNPETLTDFLTEFFAYRRLQDHTVVILTQDDLQPLTRQVIQRNIWANKVRYIKGSCKLDADLKRVRILEADGCFILSIDSTYPKGVADEMTIINAWAIKDFAPEVRQYVQIFRPENKVYVDFSSSLICEDEFKFAMLAYNCICPGTSTLITLLSHTSRGKEGNHCGEEWIRRYGKSAGNEIYQTEVSTSLIFKEYVGKSFPYASLHAHRKYGVTLVAVKSTLNEDDDIKLNPGPSHIMRETDCCYYLSITREQNMNFTEVNITAPGTSPAKSERKADAELLHRDSEASDEDVVPKEIVISGPSNGVSKDKSKFAQSAGKAFREASDHSEFQSDDSWIQNFEKNRLVTGYPPVTPYVGTNPTVSHILEEKKNICCLRLDIVCEHNQLINAKQYSWANRPIILIATGAKNGVYNFILPLRSRVLPRGTIKPIILMLKTEPTDAFLDALSWFPLVYWLKGTIQNLDDLLRAGIDIADNVVVTNRDSIVTDRFNIVTNRDNAVSNRDTVTMTVTENDEIGDCETIVTIQKLLKFFPKMKITTELSSTGMMRFLHFEPGNKFAQNMSRLEKKEREKGSHIAFMFRRQFASGNVFSSSMIHTLLYQAILKDFVVPLTRLVLGIEETEGSGFLTGLTVTAEDLIDRGTYGKMFSYLCATSGSIPIGIYRTQTNEGNEKKTVGSKAEKTIKKENKEISDIIQSRFAALGFSKDDWGSYPNGKLSNSYDENGELENKVTYVLVNPNVVMPLEAGDFIYYLRPTPFTSKNDSNAPLANESLV